jgi:hypothetical protein
VYAKVISYSGSSTTAAYTLTLTYTAGSTPPPVTELLANPASSRATRRGPRPAA